MQDSATQSGGKARTACVGARKSVGEQTPLRFQEPTLSGYPHLAAKSLNGHKPADKAARPEIIRSPKGCMPKSARVGSDLERVGDRTTAYAAIFKISQTYCCMHIIYLTRPITYIRVSAWTLYCPRIRRSRPRQALRVSGLRVARVR